VHQLEISDGVFEIAVSGAAATLIREPRAWRLDLDGPPIDEPSAQPRVAAIVAAAVEVIALAGGGRLQLWRSDPTAAADAVADAAGLVTRRDLLQLRRPLPFPLSSETAPRLAVRSFCVGSDEQAWLAVNNRAFAWHPEQSDWDLDTLRSREAESWFDPDGFLLYEERGQLAGFCWTKIHPGLIGEIYVIGVDPDFAGRGLGGALTLAGLDYLAATGQTIAMLYVEATNVAARALYDGLGFTVSEVQRAYQRIVQPATPVTPPR
jgi:mycothiol synthase